MIGGAAYSYPKDFLKNYPYSHIDVVEIDAALTELARTYFRLSADPRLAIYHEDARAFLNTTKNKYDVIYGDAFSSTNSIPYQLTTLETAQRMHELLNDDGVVIINTITAIEGKRGRFLRAEYATFKAVFPQVYIFPVDVKKELNMQNIIMVALKSEQAPSFTSNNEELNKYLSHLWIQNIEKDMPILTDDYAPVDYYTLGVL